MTDEQATPSSGESKNFIVCDTCKQKLHRDKFSGPHGNRSTTCYTCNAEKKSAKVQAELAARKAARTKQRFKKATVKRLQTQAATKPKTAAEKQQSAEERAEQQARLELASRELARRSLLHFTERNVKDYMPGWVHEDICRRLEKFMADIEAKKSPRLMLALPPRTGKSELASTQFPAWVLGHHPEWEIISSSYSVELPLGFSRRVRAMLASQEYNNLFPDTKLSDDSKAAEAWRTTQRGGFRAAGVSGGITGMGSHCIHPNTLIYSKARGKIPASNIQVGEHIYGYNHQKGCGEWTVVRAIAANLSTEPQYLVNGVCVTAEHPVYTVEHGYKPAAQLTQDMSVMRRDEGATRCRVQELPSEGAAADRHANLRQLWLHLQAAAVRSRQGAQAARRKCAQLLLPYLLRRLQACTSSRVPHESWSLPALPQNACWEEPKEVLLDGMLRRLSAGAQGRCKLWRDVLTPKVEGAGARWANLPALREGRCQTGNASHRQRRDPQHSRQSDHFMQDVPQLVSRFAGADAESLAGGLRGRGAFVVDLQTDTQNFFAGDILVHNCLILDDVVKDEAEAESELSRNRAWNWYGATAYTRLSPGGGVLVIGTRWHDDDVSGRLEMQMAQGLKEIADLEAEIEELLPTRHEKVVHEAIVVLQEQLRLLRASVDHWDIVKYPAIAETDQYLDRYSGAIVAPEDMEALEEGLDLSNRYKLLRKKGEALHPARFPLPLMLKYKRTLQPRHWSALYQQNPVPDEGMFFTRDMFSFSSTPPAKAQWQHMTTFVAWDLAISLKATSDYTVGAVGALDAKDNLWVIDVIRGRWDTDGIAELIIDTHIKYGAHMTGIEKTALELAIKPTLERRMKERKEYILLAEGKQALRPITDKIMRARPLQGRMQQGSVMFPERAPWLEALQHELLRFPSGIRDDQVDALAWLVRMAAWMPLPQSLSERLRSHSPDGFKSWRDRLSSLMDRGAARKNFMTR